MSTKQSTLGFATKRIGPLEQFWRGRAGFLFILPTFVFLGYFLYYPAWVSLSGAFTDWDGFNAPNFIGLENFTRAFTDPIMGTAAQNNIIQALWGIPLAIVPSFLTAELIFSLRNLRAQYAYRTLFVIPIVVPSIVGLLLWRSFYGSSGLINQLLGSAHLESLQRVWLTNASTALNAIIFMGFPWIGAFNLLIFYAGLQNISSEVRDAATLDGSVGVHRILKIDIPLCGPQIRLMLILSLLASAQRLVEPLVMTNGGPGFATTYPILYMFNTAVQEGNFGYSMALSFILFVVILILNGINNAIAKRYQ